MNINILIAIIFIFILMVATLYMLYLRAEGKRQEKIKKMIKRKNKKIRSTINIEEKMKSNMLNEKKSQAIIIKQKRNDKLERDVISEAISEMDDIISFDEMNFDKTSENKNLIIERDFSPKNILVVDDSRVILKKTRSVLEKMDRGYIIETADDGAMALEMLTVDKNKFNLIITDMDMPVMDGAELIRNVKNDVVMNKIPIIVVTGVPKLITNGLEDKVDGILEKPYQDQDLIYQTKNALQD